MHIPGLMHKVDCGLDDPERRIFPLKEEEPDEMVWRSKRAWGTEQQGER
jgi:hypothetical protein